MLESEQLNKSTALESVQDQLARITEDNSQIERELHDLQVTAAYINMTLIKITWPSDFRSLILVYCY